MYGFNLKFYKHNFSTPFRVYQYTESVMVPSVIQTKSMCFLCRTVNVSTESLLSASPDCNNAFTELPQTTSSEKTKQFIHHLTTSKNTKLKLHLYTSQITFNENNYKSSNTYWWFLTEINELSFVQYQLSQGNSCNMETKLLASPQLHKGGGLIEMIHLSTWFVQ